MLIYLKEDLQLGVGQNEVKRCPKPFVKAQRLGMGCSNPEPDQSTM